MLRQEELGTWKKGTDGRSYNEDVQTDVNRKKNNVREERMSEGMSGEGGSSEGMRVKRDGQEGLARIRDSS